MEKMISIVSPVYKAEAIVDELVKRISEEVSRITENYEIILVEDCGGDNSWKKIRENCLKDKRVKGIKLSRNFGQHYAITAGMNYAKGDYVIVMDCDLQHNPVHIKDLIKEAEKGNEIVLTKTTSRSHSFIKNFYSKTFYVIFNWLTETQIAEPNIGNFSLLGRKAINSFRSYNEYQRHYLPIIKSLGFSTSVIEIEHDDRYSGKSSYSFNKLVNLAISGITSQSNKLLRLIVVLGLVFVMLAFIFSFIIIFGYFKYGFMAGWTSIIIVLLLSTGVIMISMGVIGIYVGNIFSEVKKRPLYLVEEELNI